MKTILFVIQSLRNLSGTERVASTLANLFVKHLDSKVIIVNQEVEKKDCPYDLNEQVEVVCCPGNLFQFAIGIQKIIKQQKVDYVLIHNMGRLSLLMSLLHKYQSTFISLEHVAFTSRPALVQKLSRVLYRRIDKVVVLTDADLESYKNLINQDKLQKIHNTCSFAIERVPFSDRKKLVIAAGRLTYQKNFAALLSAWTAIAEKFSSFELQIYGDGEEKEMLQKMIEEKHLHNVKLMGVTQNMREVYKEAMCFVMSSRYEGLPMVLIEAQTFGLPIVSFDCPHGPSEVIIPNRNGVLVENQNIDELICALSNLLSNMELLQQYSSNAVKDAERFQPTKIIEDWKVLLQ